MLWKVASEWEFVGRMIAIEIKHTLGNLIKKMDNKKIVLNDAIHTSGYIVEGAVKTDIATYPSVDTGGFMGGIQTDNSKLYQSTIFSNKEYSIFLEKGTSPHFIFPSTKKALRWKGGGKWFFSKGHMVRGIAPRRHFERSAIATKPIVIKFIEDKLKTASV